MFGSSNNSIGGPGLHELNVISGNSLTGISLGSTLASNSNTLFGNYIGTDVTGTHPIANGQHGLLLDHAIGNSIIGNVISGNTLDGILVQRVNGGSTNNSITRNFIGVDSSGQSKLSNGGHGILISGADDTTIGGTAQGAGNIIAGNEGSGLQIDGASGLRILGNFIGTNASGTANLGNQSSGMSLINHATGNTVGGTSQGTANLIANNAGDGILLDSTSNRNSFLSNSISSNGGLGINFGNGPTPNQTWPPGTATGANDRQNYPILGKALQGVGVLAITGTLQAAPSTQFLIQFFASPTADASGHGEAQTYLG